MSNIVNENKITDSRIFNVDKISHTVLQHPDKIKTQNANFRLQPSHRANEDRMQVVYVQ
jgi:hypothetical protein